VCPPNPPADSDDRSKLDTWLLDDDIEVGIVGQGIVGAMTAKLVSSAGMEVIGYDRDKSRVANLRAETKDRPLWKIVDDSSCLANADVIVIAVRISAASQKPDLTSIEQACRCVAEFPNRNRLVIIETTLPPGTTRQLSEEHLNPHNNPRTQIAYCPERLKEGDSESDIRRTARLVGGLTPEATRSACFFLDRLGIEAHPVSRPEVAELSKLLENTFLTTGIALVGEITRIAHAIGICASEVATAAASKPTGYYPFWPGAGIGGHCLINDMRLLQKTASDLGVASPVIEALGTSCKEISPAVINFLTATMEQHEMALGNSRIWLIGIGFKIGSADISETPASDLVRMLRASKAKIVYSDSLVGTFEVDNLPVDCVDPHSWPADISAAIILAGDPAIDLSRLRSRVPVVLDLGGTRIMSGSNEGIIRL